MHNHGKRQLVLQRETRAPAHGSMHKNLRGHAGALLPHAAHTAQFLAVAVPEHAGALPPTERNLHESKRPQCIRRRKTQRRCTLFPKAPRRHCVGTKLEFFPWCPRHVLLLPHVHRHPGRDRGRVLSAQSMLQIFSCKRIGLCNHFKHVRRTRSPCPSCPYVLLPADQTPTNHNHTRLAPRRRKHCTHHARHRRRRRNLTVLAHLRASPRPSWPWSPLPQTNTAPVRGLAIECRSPAAILDTTGLGQRPSGVASER